MVVRYERPLRPDELMHYGVLGMKWGVRRYQNEDGTWKGSGARARHAQQQAASESGHTKHQDHKTHKVSNSVSKRKTKGKHDTAKTVAKVAGVTLAVAAGAYAAHKTGVTKKLAQHGSKTLSQIRSKATTAANKASTKAKGTAKKAYDKYRKAMASEKGQKVINAKNYARRRVNNFRNRTRHLKNYAVVGYNTIDTATDIYGAGKYVKKNKNNFKTKEGRRKIANETIKNKKWRRKKVKSVVKKAAINAALRHW